MSDRQLGGLGEAQGAGGGSRCVHCGGATEGSWLVCGWCGQPLAPSVELPAGTHLADRFSIESVLGRGGFGITYRAEDLRLHRHVAVKELFPPSATRHGTGVLVDPRDREGFEVARNRFRREAASLARFNHPGIVRVFEVLEANNTAYLVMELVDGRSLLEVLAAKGKPFAVDEVLDVVLRAGRALEDVHAAGLLHRDINPSNLMLDAAGRVVLIDFGLARSFGDDISGGVTRAVTPGYAPPEQYAGSARIGPTCDVYGLASTAYKLLTGVTPTNVFDRQAGAELPAPHLLCPDVPGLVSNAVLDGMELNADHRPATAAALLDRLGLHGQNPGQRALVAGRPDVGDDATRADATGTLGDASPYAHPVPVPAPSPIGVADVPAGFVGANLPVMPNAYVPRSIEPPPQVLDLRGGRAPFAPWHDGSPPVVGPGASWRGWVTFPLVAAIVALASAAPLIVSALVTVLLLPAAATVGDVEVHRYRQAIGAERRGWHRAAPSTVVPLLFLRNLGVALVRALPAIAIGAIGVVAERAIAGSSIRGFWRDWSIRLCGVSMALVLLIPARHGGRTFRSDPGITRWSAWAMEGRERPGTRTATIWVIAVFGLALGAWLHPELWPLS